MNFPYSTVLIASAADRGVANAIFRAMGWGVSCCSVPLFTDGILQPSHFGLHTTSKVGFASYMEAGDFQNIPDINWALYGLKPHRVSETLSRLIFSAKLVEDTTPSVHFEQVLEEVGLSRE